MTRRIVLWIVLVSASAGMALNASMRARAQEDHLSEINRSIASEEERIRILSAEWSMLKTPDRLETLASRHLDGLGRIKPKQMASLADIPETLPETEATPAPAPVTPEPVTRVVAQAETPKPVAVSERIAPAVRKAAPKKDELADVIAQSNDNDEIRILIEREPTPGIIMASAGRTE